MRYRSIYIVFLIVFISSCGDFEEKQSESTIETKKQEINPDEKISLELGNSFFSIPSPVQIAMELQEGGKTFNPELLHDPESIESYNSEFSKSLILGIYGTDLAYCAIFFIELKYFIA